MYDYVIQFFDGEYLENWTDATVYTTEWVNQACTFTCQGAKEFIEKRGWKDAEIVKV